MRDPDSGDCIPCPKGTYSDTAEATSCTSCAEGERTPSEATNNASLCFGKKPVTFEYFFSILDLM